MNYILKFVPFNDSTKFAGVGMAGNIMIILNELLSINKLSSSYSSWLLTVEQIIVCLNMFYTYVNIHLILNFTYPLYLNFLCPICI